MTSRKDFVMKTATRLVLDANIRCPGALWAVRLAEELWDLCQSEESAEEKVPDTQPELAGRSARFEDLKPGQLLISPFTGEVCMKLSGGGAVKLESRKTTVFNPGCTVELVSHYTIKSP
jgi:hypothetical protein